MPHFLELLLRSMELDTITHTSMRLVDLPLEIIFAICDSLDCKDLLAVRATCSWLRRPATDAVRLEVHVKTGPDEAIIVFNPFGTEHEVSLDDSSMDWDLDVMEIPECWVARIKDFVCYEQIETAHSEADARIMYILSKLGLKQEFALHFLDPYFTNCQALRDLVEEINKSCLQFAVSALINVNHSNGNDEIVFGAKFGELYLDFLHPLNSSNVVKFHQIRECSIHVRVGRTNSHILKELHRALQTETKLSLDSLKLIEVPLNDEADSLEMLLGNQNILCLGLQGCTVEKTPEIAKISCGAEHVQVTNIAELRLFNLTKVVALDAVFADDSEISVSEDVIPQLNKILPQLQTLKVVNMCLHPASEPEDYRPHRRLLDSFSKLPNLERLKLHFACEAHGISTFDVQGTAEACPKLAHLSILTEASRLEFSHGNISGI